MSLADSWRRPFAWAGDSSKHQFLYDLQMAFKLFTAISFGITLFMVLQQWRGASVAVAVFFLSWLFWMISLGAERLARRGLVGPVTEREFLETEGAADSSEELRTKREIERRATKFAVEILAGIVLAAIVLAVLLVERELLGLTILLFVAYLTLFGAPFWIAAVHQEASDERKRLTHRE